MSEVEKGEKSKITSEFFFSSLSQWMVVYPFQEDINLEGEDGHYTFV